MMNTWCFFLKNDDSHFNNKNSFVSALLLDEIHVFPEWTFQKHEKMCREPPQSFGPEQPGSFAGELVGYRKEAWIPGREQRWDGY